MLRNQTTLVLGAGSSREFKLPDGAGLAELICTAVNFYTDAGHLREGDADLWNAFRALKDEKLGDYLRAGRLIARGLPTAQSIDEFLFNHGADPCVVLTGKAAIANFILKAEQGSNLDFWKANSDDQRTRKFHSLADTWLYRFFSRLTTDVPVRKVDQIFKNLRIVNFNYDRCVEHFLCEALQVAYSIEAKDAEQVVNTLRISHPYGQVGLLPWQKGQGLKISFGSPGARIEPVEVAQGIKTFTEQNHDPDEVEMWRTWIRGGHQVVFLGFAFHSQNVALLDRKETGGSHYPNAYATVFGTSDADRQVFKKAIARIRGNPPNYADPTELVDAKCADFMKDFGRLLTS